MTSVKRVLVTASRKTPDGLLDEVVSLHPHLQKMTYSLELPKDTSKEGYRRLTEALEYDGWYISGDEWARKEDMTKIGELVSAMSRGEAFMSAYGNIRKEIEKYGSQTAINFNPENFLERVKRTGLESTNTALLSSFIQYDPRKDEKRWESDIISFLTALGFTSRETPYQESVAKKSKEMALPE